MKQNILIFQHSVDCPPGTTLEFLRSRNLNFHIHLWPHAKTIPDLNQYSGLIVLGWPRNVDEEDEFPWLKNEKEFLRQFLKLDKPILGICLGAQLLAEVLGANVCKHSHVEAGWKEIEINPEISNLIPEGIKSMPFFQWHGYRFTTPADAKKFAKNEITADQGFVYRNNVVAVQFHPETDIAWLEQCAKDPDWPRSGQHVESGTSFLAQAKLLNPMKNWYFQLLQNLFGDSSA